MRCCSRKRSPGRPGAGRDDVLRDPSSAFHVSQAPGFEEWLEEERARLQRLCLGALEELAATAEQKGHWDQTVRWRRRFAELEPLDARNSSRLVLALAATGDRMGALRTAEVTGRRLKEEYGTEADPELAAAAVAVRAMPNGLRQEVPSMATAPTAAGQSPPTPRTRPVWKATSCGRSPGDGDRCPR